MYIDDIKNLIKYVTCIRDSLVNLIDVLSDMEDDISDLRSQINNLKKGVMNNG